MIPYRKSYLKVRALHAYVFINIIWQLLFYRWIYYAISWYFLTCHWNISIVSFQLLCLGVFGSKAYNITMNFNYLWIIIFLLYREMWNEIPTLLEWLHIGTPSHSVFLIKRDIKLRWRYEFITFCLYGVPNTTLELWSEGDDFVSQ